MPKKMRNDKTGKDMDLTFLTLEEIKAQCRIAAEDTEEDGLLQIYGVAAEQTVLGLTNRSVLECVDEYGTDLDGAFPSSSLLALMVSVPSLRVPSGGAIISYVRPSHISRHRSVITLVYRIVNTIVSSR